MIYIVMGVSSSGKTLIGKKLAEALQAPFYDADDFHPERNIRKMKNGQPLNDEDRWPWLESLREHEITWDKSGDAVLACSALKQAYREKLSPENISVTFIYLKGSKALIGQRMKKRKHHFMANSLLDSQFEALEEPQDAITIHINQTPNQIIHDILEKLKN